MWIMRWLMLLLVATAAAADEPDPATAWEKCGVLYEKDGKFEVEVMASLAVIKATSRARFALPEDAPPGVKAVQCGRDSIVPEENDYKVIVAGYPFYIIAQDGRMAVIEGREGRLDYRAVDGEFTEEEIPEIQRFLEQSQGHINADAGDKARDEG